MNILNKKRIKKHKRINKKYNLPKGYLKRKSQELYNKKIIPISVGEIRVPIIKEITKEPVRICARIERPIDEYHRFGGEQMKEWMEEEIVYSITHNEDFKSLIEFKEKHTYDTITLLGSIEILKEK